jgi:hypothetical protein
VGDALAAICGVSVEMDFAGWLRPVRWRARAQTALLGLPLVLQAAALVWRLAGLAPALVVAGFGVVATAFLAAWSAARFDMRWLLWRLDAERPDVEDSADLLLAAPQELGVLQRLQRQRLLARLAAGPMLAKRPLWDWRRLALAWGLGLAVAAAALFWPGAAGPMGREGLAAGRAVQGPPVLTARTLRVVPPGYTGLPARTADGLSVKAPVGSALIWRLRFAPQADAVGLVFLDGRKVALVRDGEDFVGRAVLDRSALYRVEALGEAKPGALHRLDAVADAPPVVRVLAPEATVTQGTAGQRRWDLRFEARDDHGVLAGARLRLIRAEGSGENVRFRESVRTLGGTGPARARRFAVSVDLAALGMGPGDELVAQLMVRDNRPGGGQAGQSASLILRLPSEREAAVAGLEGMVQRVMPAYFRSQRQIIIDIEALLKARPGLGADIFAARSNNIGADQRILRLRYGQFLGEESEGQPRAPSLADLLTSDGDTSTKAAPKLVLPEGHDAFDGHDHGSSGRAAPQFGEEGDVLAQYGHAHGDSETATLFDPRTRETLRQALDAMWQAERSLRQAEPAAALPQAYAALGFIKDVQQATRIFLQRTGPVLPPIDETRRLGGKREGILPGAVGVRAQDDAAAVPRALFAVLAARAPEAGELRALEGWLAGAEVPDRLALVAAIDAVRGDPDCAACRARLRAALWGALAVPPAAVARRESDAVGGRYLDALR